MNTKILGLITFYLLHIPGELNASDPLWLRYPAISPNGTEIVFTYKGDLYKVPAEGGRAVQLTTHTARDFQPVWSTDGKMIAFSSNRYGNYDVFLVSAEGGAPKRLTFHSADDQPSAFSTEGNLVYFSSARMDHKLSSLFPTGAMSELYSRK